MNGNKDSQTRQLETQGLISQKGRIKRMDDALIRNTSTTFLNPAHNLSLGWLSKKTHIHIPEAGLNPLTDTAIPLFTIMGQLASQQEQNHPIWAIDDLIEKIHQYQERAYHCAYSKEFLNECIPLTIYALCVTFDTILLDREQYHHEKNTQHLTSSFFTDPPSEDSFFIILKQLTSQPNRYIDILEFMYLCLNLGFKCKNQAHIAGYTFEQIEAISNSLYKLITAHRGNFNRKLSPYPITPNKKSQYNKPLLKENFLSHVIYSIKSLTKQILKIKER